MEMVIKVIAACLLGALLAVLLKKSNPELSLLLALSACIVVLVIVVRGIENVHEFLDEIITRSGLTAEIFDPLWKTVGIALICRIGTDLCKDAGENAMASLVETTGALGAVLVAIPLFQAVWEMLRSFI